MSVIRMRSRDYLASDSKGVIVSVHVASPRSSGMDHRRCLLLDAAFARFNAAMPTWRVEGYHVIFPVFVIKGCV